MPGRQCLACFRVGRAEGRCETRWPKLSTVGPWHTKVIKERPLSTGHRRTRTTRDDAGAVASAQRMQQCSLCFGIASLALWTAEQVTGTTMAPRQNYFIASNRVISKRSYKKNLVKFFPFVRPLCD
jgi:hypothetical protein